MSRVNCLVVSVKAISCGLAIALLLTVTAYPLLIQVSLCPFSTRTAGVEVGDRWKLKIELFGSPATETTPYYDYFINTESLTIRVLWVEGTNVTLEGTLLFKNQTETTNQTWLDIETGYSGAFSDYDLPPCAILAANLEEGEPMFTKRFPFNNLYLGRTLTRTYLNASLEVNPLQFSIFGYGVEAYYAKRSGILCEAQISAGTYTVHAIIEDASIKQFIPEFLTSAPLTIAGAILVLVALANKSMRKKQKQ